MTVHPSIFPFFRGTGNNDKLAEVIFFCHHDFFSFFLFLNYVFCYIYNVYDTKRHMQNLVVTAMTFTILLYFYTGGLGVGYFDRFY